MPSANVSQKFSPTASGSTAALPGIRHGHVLGKPRQAIKHPLFDPRPHDFMPFQSASNHDDPHSSKLALKPPNSVSKAFQLP